MNPSTGSGKWTMPSMGGLHAGTRLGIVLMLGLAIAGSVWLALTVARFADPCEPMLVAAGDERVVPKLLVVNDGSIGHLRLEWTGGPEDATSWQYRQREWQGSTPPPWGDWATIPDSDASTCSFQAPVSPGGAYEFEVRAVGAFPGEPSVNARVDPYALPDERRPNFGAANEASGLRWLSAYGVTEGDGATPWRLGDFTVTIPDGVRVYGNGWSDGHCFSDPAGELVEGEPAAEPKTPDCPTEGVWLVDYETGAVLELTLEGEVIERWLPRGGEAKRISALFDQIVASIQPLD